MSEMDDALNSILSDPGKMQQIMDLAGSLMGSGSQTGEKHGGYEPAGGGPAERPAQEKRASPESELLASLSGMPMGDIIAGAKKALGASGSGSGDKRALLSAMEPWMSEGRRSKLDRAMKLAAAMKVALVIFGKTGADGR